MIHWTLSIAAGRLWKRHCGANQDDVAHVLTVVKELAAEHGAAKAEAGSVRVFAYRNRGGWVEWTERDEPQLRTDDDNPCIVRGDGEDG